MDSIVKDNLPSIQKLLTTYKVESAYLFGSAAKNTMQVNSENYNTSIIMPIV